MMSFSVKVIMQRNTKSGKMKIVTRSGINKNAEIIANCEEYDIWVNESVRSTKSARTSGDDN